MKILGTRELTDLLRDVGIDAFLAALRERLRLDFAAWHHFAHSPRHAIQYPQGVIELMPCSGEGYYSFKYVNGHPHNVRHGLPTVTAFGALAETEHGIPLMLTEMTLLTALRTAAVAALGAEYLARSDARVLGILGCGAQAEFQVLALAGVRSIDRVRYFDVDTDAMEKFARNLSPRAFQMEPCDSAGSLLPGCDILVTATAARRRACLFAAAETPPGLHIHALGGDCAGKTEIDPALVARARVVVEYAPQTRIEGEIQNLPQEARGPETAAAPWVELWELVDGSRPGRADDDEITLFDSVGIALEDYSTLRLLYDLVRERGLGTEIDLVALPQDPRDLYGLVFS